MSKIINRSTLVIFISAIAICMLINISCKKSSGTADPDSGIMLTVDDSGKTIDVDEGSIFKIKLMSQTKPDYQWAVKSNSYIVSIVGEAREKGKEKNTDFQIFSIKAKTKGNGKIVLSYKKVPKKGGIKNVKSEKDYTVTVNVK